MIAFVVRVLCRPAICWFTLCLLLVVCSQSARCQDVAAAEDPEWHFRFELFQMLLEQNDLQSTTNLPAVLANPQRSVLLVLGDSAGMIPPRTVESFCEAGGRVLIACDSEYSGGRLAEFQAGSVEASRSRHRYQGFSDCLQITNLDPNHPLTDGVGSLVVNRSGWLGKPKWFQPDWDVIARLPPDCQPSNASTEPLLVEFRLPNSGGQAIADSAGRMFLAADQSLFTNGMLWHGDNAILAINLSKLLCAGNRSQLCFIANGAALPSYQQSPALNPNDVPPLPDDVPFLEADLETQMKVVSLALRHIEESNLHNKLVANRPWNLSVAHYKRWVYLSLIAAAVLAFLWALFATTNAQHSPMPNREMKTAHALTADQRIESAEFGQAASMLARGLCRTLTGSEDSAVWHQQLRHTLAVHPAVRAKKISQKQVAELLDLAVNTRTIHISRKRFEAVGENIQTIRNLHQQGALPVG